MYRVNMLDLYSVCIGYIKNNDSKKRKQIFFLRIKKLSRVNVEIAKCDT